MPRSPRLIVPGIPVHVIQRGNNRTSTFYSGEDFERYRETLLDASRRYRCAIHAYVLMTNHVHLLITPEDERGPSRMMQLVGRRYVRWMNARHQRTGTLWEGRFRSCPIDSEQYLFACTRYIELNPVRAGMVDDPLRYRWSSYRHNAYGDPDALITPHLLYGALGSTPAERQTAYRTLCLQPIEPRTLDRIRRAANQGTTLGDASVRQRIEAAVKRPADPRLPGGDGTSATCHASRLEIEGSE